MAWYDFLTPNSVPKHARRVQDRDLQADDRMQSMRWLADQKTPESFYALCKRFDLQLDHQLKDRGEKDAVIDMLAEGGPPALEAARSHALHSPNFQHSVRVIERMEGAASATALLLELLSHERVENEFHPEKKRTLLLTLAEREDERIIHGAVRFLADFDEGVRHAAVEAIVAQPGEAGRAPLLGALTNPKEESTRVRGRLAEVFAARAWEVADEGGWLAEHLPGGYQLVAGRLIRR